MAKPKQAAIVEDKAVYILQAGISVYVKTADICALTGKSNQWIGQLTSQGVINKVATPHGSLYDIKSSIQAYCSMLEKRSELSGDDEESNAIEKLKRKSEAELKRAKAVIAQAEAMELKGKMHRSEDVAALTEDLIYTIRGMLMALPGRLAVDTANAPTAAETSEIIRTEVHHIMEELSQYKYDPTKYDERVRERMNWSVLDNEDNDDD